MKKDKVKWTTERDQVDNTLYRYSPGRRFRVFHRGEGASRIWFAQRMSDDGVYRDVICRSDYADKTGTALTYRLYDYKLSSIIQRVEQRIVNDMFLTMVRRERDVKETASDIH